MIRDPFSKKPTLMKLKEKLPLKNLTKLLSNLSEMYMLPKPQAFDSTERTNIYNEELVEANEAATRDSLHDVDAVLESYKKEIITKIFKILNIISEIKANEENQPESSTQLPFIQEIMANPLSKD